MNTKIFFGILLTALFFTSFVSAGDVLEIGTGSDLLELREPIGDVRNTITSVEMPNLLRDFFIDTNRSSTVVNQYLRFFDSAELINNGPVVNYTENRGVVGGEVKDYLYVQDSDNPVNSTTAFFEYELEFQSGLESEINSTRLLDLNFENMEILDKTYLIGDTNVNTSTDEITLTLFGETVFDILGEGETKNYNLEGVDYQVTVMIIEDVSPATVTFEINGQITNQLQAGQYMELNDGTHVIVKRIVLNEAGEAGSGDIVEMYLGATKLVLKDNSYTDTNFYQGVEIDSEDIINGLVKIVAVEQSSSTELSISSIKYRLSADALNGDDVWVEARHGLREYLDEGEGMLGSKWDIYYDGLDNVRTSIVKLDPSGDDEYKLIFENIQGLVYNIPYVTNEGNFKYGTDDRDLVFEEGIYNSTAKSAADQRPTVGHLDYFILMGGSRWGPFGNESSHVMRYGNYDANNNELKFEDMSTGQTYLVTYSTTGPANGTLGSGDLSVGGTTHKVYVANATTGIPPLIIDMNSDGQLRGEEIKITVKGGAIIDLGDHANSTGGSWTEYAVHDGANLSGNWTNTGNLLKEGFSIFNVTTPQNNFDEGGPSTLNSSGDEWTSIAVEQREGNGIGIIDYSSNLYLQNDVMFSSNGGINKLLEDEIINDYYSGMTDYGALWAVYNNSNNLTDNPETLTIEYPLSQRGVNVYVVEDINDFGSDVEPPIINILSPAPINYNGSSLMIDISAWDENGVDAVWYVYNGITYGYLNPILFEFEEGTNYLKAYANDTSGNVAWDEVYFDINTLPDLLISHVEHSPINPEVGDLVTTDLTLLNNGTDINGSFNWVYDFDYGTNINSFSMNSGDSLNLSFSHNYTEGGDYRFYFEVDPTNAIEELNETNNVLLYDIFVDGTTDLNPVLISKKKDPNNRNNVILTYRINNFGNVYAENFDYNVLYGDGTGTGGIISNRVDPNGHYDFNLTHEYNTLGIYDISFEVDSMNMFAEFNETNNLVETKVRIPCDKRIPGLIARCAPKKR